MGSARSGDVRPRRSRRSRKGSPADAPRGQLLSESHKRLLQIGSAAAALGSVLALVFTVGDRVSGLFENDGTPRVRIDRVELETMPFRTYLVTKDAKLPNELPRYGSKTDLDRDVLVVSFPARFERSSRGVLFPARLTLQARNRDDRIVAVDAFQLQVVLDAGDDDCACHAYFPLRSRGQEYRVEVQISRPSAPAGSDPLDEERSDWYRA